jgi:hypothetical protein
MLFTFEEIDPALSAASPNPVHKYGMAWWNPADQSAHNYCAGAPKTPGGPPVLDSVVFMGGIDVNPINGAVVRNPDVVTLSCSLGAIATAYRWGYDYKPLSLFGHPLTEYNATALWYFNAAIQMKRASYCGDDRHYTMANTDIYISDAKSIQDGIQAPSLIEAFWTPQGASCVNVSQMRHPELADLYEGRPPTICEQNGAIKQLPACPLNKPSDFKDQSYAESLASARQIKLVIPPGGLLLQ